MTRVRTAAIQTDPVFGEIESNLSRALALVPTDCDLAVLPELFATGYQFRDRTEALELGEDPRSGPVTARLREFAGDRRLALVAGLAERSGSEVYNSAILVRPDGTWEIYRKIHLFWNEKTIFDPGDRGFRVFEACGTRLGVMICFDWFFPEAARTLALRGATILCHPSNLVLSHCPDAMFTRCLENGVYAVTANRVGHEARIDPPLDFIGRSQILAPTGERLASCDGTTEGVALATLDPATCTKDVSPGNNLWDDRRPEFYIH